MDRGQTLVRRDAGRRGRRGRRGVGPGGALQRLSPHPLLGLLRERLGIGVARPLQGSGSGRQGAPIYLPMHAASVLLLSARFLTSLTTCKARLAMCGRDSTCSYNTLNSNIAGLPANNSLLISLPPHSNQARSSGREPLPDSMKIREDGQRYGVRYGMRCKSHKTEINKDVQSLTDVRLGWP